LLGTQKTRAVSLAVKASNWLHLNDELCAGQHQRVICASAVSRSIQRQPQHLSRIKTAMGHTAQRNRLQNALQ
jgi:hypothetical protein